MSTNELPDLSAAELISLRDQPDAVKVITARLRVKEMGPADHIRTKHEVKAFVESAGDLQQAEAIITRARARHDLQRTQQVTAKMTQQRGQRTSD